ncbi:MAG: type II secretion system F family protein [Candidatus Cloacimonetes bacterium]|nr:type II secretion system F family protein [Candidatus Cloacimonadota bacterium]
MATFSYIIKDAKGARVEGILKASKMDDVIDKLSKEGAVIISVKATSESSFQGNMSLFDKLLFVIYKLRTSVSLKTLVFFTRQLSTMFSAGLTLEKAVSDLKKEETNNRFKKVLTKISNDIKKGYSLSESMEQHPGVFNPLYVSLVKAGEISGTLHTVLDDLSDYLEKLEDNRRKVGSAMMYPIFILIFLSAVVWGLFYFIIPMFSEVYGRFGADLPGPTLVAIAISKVIRENIFATLLIILAVFMTGFLFSLTDRGKYLIDSIKLKLPVIGMLIRNSIMSKFSRTFSILMAAGVPIMDTLELIENVVQNAVIESAVRETRIMVKEGYSIAGAMRKTGVFPPTLLQLTATGEETGDMDKLMGKAATFYEKLVDSVVERLTSLIEPVLIILMAAVIGTIIVVIYLPIFNLGLAISAGMK